MSLRSQKSLMLNIVNHSSFTSHILSLLLLFLLRTLHFKHLYLITLLVALFLSSNDLASSSSKSFVMSETELD